MSNKPHDYQQIVRETYDGLPIVDAEQDLRIIVLNDDIQTAEKREPQNCILAKACHRQIGATKMLFFRNVAYIDLPAPKGGRRVERYMLGSDAKDLVREFDQGVKIEGERVYTLRAPKASYRLDAKHKYNKKHRKASLKGKMTGTNANKGRKRKPRSLSRVDAEVRNGTGMVQILKSGTDG